MHFKKAQNTNAFNDKIYNKLKNNETRDKILKRTLEWNDCTYEKTFNFLLLLKQLENFLDIIIYQPINTAEWIKVVKAAKKRSLSSIFSGRNYTMYKYTLESHHMTALLVNYYNLIIKYCFFLSR